MIGDSYIDVFWLVYSLEIFYKPTVFIILLHANGILARVDLSSSFPVLLHVDEKVISILYYPLSLHTAFPHPCNRRGKEF